MREEGEKKYNSDFSTLDYYSYFRKNFKGLKFKSKYIEGSSSSSIDVKLYRAVLSDYFKEVIKYLYENNRYTIPCNLGWIYIAKTKSKIHKKYSPGIALPVDWKESKRLGKKVYLLNEDREGFVYKFYWKKGRRHFGLRWYRFIPSRANKRNLAKILKQNKEVDFFERIYTP